VLDACGGVGSKVGWVRLGGAGEPDVGTEDTGEDRLRPMKGQMSRGRSASAVAATVASDAFSIAWLFQRASPHALMTLVTAKPTALITAAMAVSKAGAKYEWRATNVQPI